MCNISSILTVFRTVGSNLNIGHLSFFLIAVFCSCHYVAFCSVCTPPGCFQVSIIGTTTVTFLALMPASRKEDFLSLRSTILLTELWKLMGVQIQTNSGNATVVKYIQIAMFSQASIQCFTTALNLLHCYWLYMLSLLFLYFRYGREDLESLAGLLHKKDIYSVRVIDGRAFCLV